jgi:hypothetical protein
MILTTPSELPSSGPSRRRVDGVAVIATAEGGKSDGVAAILTK